MAGDCFQRVKQTDQIEKSEFWKFEFFRGTSSALPNRQLRLGSLWSSNEIYQRTHSCPSHPKGIFYFFILSNTENSQNNDISVDPDLKLCHFLVFGHFFWLSATIWVFLRFRIDAIVSKMRCRCLLHFLIIVKKDHEWLHIWNKNKLIFSDILHRALLWHKHGRKNMATILVLTSILSATIKGIYCTQKLSSFQV